MNSYVQGDSTAMPEPTISDELLSTKARQCLELMLSPDKRVRNQARAELKQIPTESMMDVLLEIRSKDSAEFDRKMRIHHSMLGAVLFPVLPVIVGGIVMFFNTPLGIVIGIAGSGVVVLRSWAILPGLRRNKPRGEVIHELLNNSNNPRTAVIHAEIFRMPIDKWPDREPWASAVERLIQLLPLISSEHRDTLEPRQQVALRSTLNQLSKKKSLTSTLARLATAMIQYVANMGDLASMKAVETVAARRSQNPIEQSMVAAAHSSLAILRDLDRRTKLGETMVRPSEAPSTQNAMLLRAANERAAEPETELLRAHNGEVD